MYASKLINILQEIIDEKGDVQVFSVGRSTDFSELSVEYGAFGSHCVMMHPGKPHSNVRLDDFKRLVMGAKNAKIVLPDINGGRVWWDHDGLNVVKHKDKEDNGNSNK